MRRRHWQRRLRYLRRRRFYFEHEVRASLPRLLRLLMGGFLGFAENAQRVLAEDFFDVGFAVFAFEEFLGDDGVAGDIGKVGGKLGDAVVVGAETDMVDA